MIRYSTKLIVTLSPTLLMAGCADTTLRAIHSPLYRAVSHTSTIEATAENSEDGIRRITIHVVEGEMTDCSELGSGTSVIPCRRNATAQDHVCDFDGSPSSATCTASVTIGNEEMVTYSVEAEASDGDTASTPEITYAGGFPPVASIARPMWWHRNDPMAAKIDVGFFPDSDYSGAYTNFTNDAETIAEGAFFNGQASFASTYSLFRNSFNLWAAPFGADANGCTRTFNSTAMPIAAVTDGEAIVHDLEFRDCAAVALGGAGSVWGNAGDADWLLVHESGHFLHGQADEYCCDGGYGTAGSCRNVFASESACQAAAPSSGGGACGKITDGTSTVNSWRYDDGSLETMEDRTDDSSWRDNSSRCVVDRFTNCGQGSCY